MAWAGSMALPRGGAHVLVGEEWHWWSRSRWTQVKQSPGYPCGKRMTPTRVYIHTLGESETSNGGPSWFRAAAYAGGACPRMLDRRRASWRAVSALLPRIHHPTSLSKFLPVFSAGLFAAKRKKI